MNWLTVSTGVTPVVACRHADTCVGPSLLSLPTFVTASTMWALDLSRFSKKALNDAPMSVRYMRATLPGWESSLSSK